MNWRYDSKGMIMVRKLAWVSALILFPTISCYASDAQSIRIYANVFTITSIAESKCPGVRVNDALVAKFKRKMGVTDADHGAVLEEENTVAAEMAHMVVQSSQEIWCDKAWDLLGPNGTMLKNALKRSNF